MNKEDVEVEKVEKVEQDWEQIALALAKDLVEMSQSIRTVLSNSAFNYDVIDEVKLLEHMTRQVLETYVSSDDNEEKQQD